MQTRRTSNLVALFVLAFAGCATTLASRIDRAPVAPDARIWYEEKTGPGEPYSPGSGRWKHWDDYFHSRNIRSNWRQEGEAIVADVTETNEFMQMLDWRAKPYTMSWWLDDQGRITSVLIKGNPEKPVSRLAEFKEWARVHHPEELAYLMPNDRLDPTGDRPERWRKILEEWNGARASRPQ